jgi:hypothetical protein
MDLNRALLPFSDLHSFKDFVGFVKLCAPDMFPVREGVSASEQWNLELVFEGLDVGLAIAGREGVSASLVSQCQSLFEVALAHYRAGRLQDGFNSLEAAQRILRGVKTK